MPRFLSPLSFALIATLPFLLSGCGDNSSSSTPASVTATVTAASTITADNTTTVSVALALTNQLLADTSSNTYSVTLVDQDQSQPITCGSAQNIAAGSSANFTCTAGTTSLTTLPQTHRLAAEINGTSVGQSGLIEVINPGTVGVALSSNAVTTGASSATVSVNFSVSSGNPIGQYIIQVPTTWTASPSTRICAINTTDTTCSITLTVPSTQPNSSITIPVSANLYGSSAITPSSLSLTVINSTQPALTLLYSTNIANTLYANTGGGNPTFTYTPTFQFENSTANTLSIGSVTASNLTGLTYSCNGAAATSTATCSLPTDGTYTVYSSLTTPTTANTLNDVSLSVLANNGTTVLGGYSNSIDFVQYNSGLVAVRVINNDNSKPVYLAAAYGSNMVTFNTSTGIGTVSGTSGANYSGDQYSFGTGGTASAGGVIYMPYGSSGTMLITRATGGFVNTAVPSSTDGTSPPFLLEELTYLQHLTPIPTTGPCANSSNCEQLVVDQSYVNGIAMLATAETVGAAEPYASVLTRDATFGVTALGQSMTSATLFAQVASDFATYGAPWAYNSSANPITQNLIQESSSVVSQILAPLAVQGVTSYNPFSSGYYNDYNDALWAYLTAHPIYVDASGIDPANYPNCVLEGQVNSSTHLLTFSVASGAGSCASSAASILWPANSCGTSGTDPCTDTPTITFEEFNDCDYLLAAGNNNCHPTASPVAITQTNFSSDEGLWGPNGTYRAIVGRAIAAYQAIGLLPDCSQQRPITESFPMNSENAATEVEAGDSIAFQNPSCLTAYTGSTPTYNVYVKSLSPYVSSYTYSYGDFLQSDGTITYYRGGLPTTTGNDLYSDLPYAQPVTITLY